MRTFFPLLLLAGATAVPILAGGWNVYADLRSAYGTALDRSHVLGYGAALEAPLGEGISAVARGRFLRVDQPAWGEEKRSEDAYTDAFPARYRVYGVQAALRAYPWEWLPGFFAEALLGYKRITGFIPNASPGWAADGWVSGPDIESFSNQAYEAAIGYGYRWSWGPMRASLGFAFGPEIVLRTSRFAGDGGRRATDVSDLLRFNALELGCAF